MKNGPPPTDSTDPNSTDDQEFEFKGWKVLLIGIIFCVSGVSALLYQVAWQRILVLHSGVGMYSIAMIVAAFLGGLGFGSYGGGILSKKVSQLTALRTFALLELCIGLFGFLSPYIFYDFFYLKFTHLFSNPLIGGVVHFLLLLIPTTMMGMSLPFITRGTVANPRTASQTIGYLYGINVLGAAMGALLAPWIFIRFFGIDGAIYFGALGNLLAGLLIFVLGTPAGSVSVSRVPVTARSSLGTTSGLEPPNTHPFGLWLTLYTLSGFVAISLEVISFRLIDVAVKSSAFTFGTVLAIYLLGLGIGSMAGGFVAQRVKQPLKLFLMFQCVLLLYVGVAVSLLVFSSHEWPVYSGLFQYWGNTEGVPLGPDSLLKSTGLFLSLYVLLPLFLYGFPTLIMGLSFGLLQRAVHDNPRTSGYKVGVLQSGNILGNVAGSLVAGLFLVNFLGTMGAIQFLLGLGFVFAVIGMFYYGTRGAFSVVTVLLVGLFLFLPNNSQLWHTLHGKHKHNGLVAEDAVAVVTISQKETGNAESYNMTVNGKHHSFLPYNGIAPLLGAGPALIHPEPLDIAVIGLGSGGTAWATACRKVTKSVTVYEIADMERVLLDRLAKQTTSETLPRLHALLADPRVNIIAADGRNAMVLDTQQYDLIEVDVLRPWTAYSGNLYSVEFYELLSTKLKPGGIVRSWALGEENRQAFRKVFPYFLEIKPGKALGWNFDATALIGSNEPLALEIEQWIARLKNPHVQKYLGRHISDQIVSLLQTAQYPLPATNPDLKPNRDLFPRAEFRTPQNVEEIWRKLVSIPAFN